MKNNSAMAATGRLTGNIKRSVQKRAVFLDRFIKSPRYIGSITPSSYYLAQAMVKPVPWGKVHSVAELGAGTGVFTHYINHFKRDDCQAIIFEQDPVLRQELINLYPELIYHPNAEEILDVVLFLKCFPVDCILSGLPFANFSPDLRERIITGVVDSLKPGGLFITFQYSLQMKQRLQNSFSKVEISFVPLNIPPAFVYTCHK